MVGCRWNLSEEIVFVTVSFFTSRSRHGQGKGKIQGVKKLEKKKKKKTMFFKNFEASPRTSKTSL